MTMSDKRTMEITLNLTEDLDSSTWIAGGNHFPTLEEAIEWTERTWPMTTTSSSASSSTKAHPKISIVNNNPQKGKIEQ